MFFFFGLILILEDYDRSEAYHAGQRYDPMTMTGLNSLQKMLLTSVTRCIKTPFD